MRCQHFAFWETKYILIENKIQNSSFQEKKKNQQNKKKPQKDLILFPQIRPGVTSGFSEACICTYGLFHKAPISCCCDDAGGGSSGLRSEEATPLTQRFLILPLDRSPHSVFISFQHFGGRGGGKACSQKRATRSRFPHHHCTSPRLPPLDAPTSRDPWGGGRGRGATPGFPEPQNAKRRSRCQEPDLKAESREAPLPVLGAPSPSSP